MGTGERSEGLSHVAIGVAPGTLTPAFRGELVSFYGEHLGWAELEEFARADRMTVAIGGGDYLNLREVEGAIGPRPYEHLGMRLPDPEAVERAWDALTADDRCAGPEELQRGPGTFRQFRLRHLLPLVLEIQHVPAGRMDRPDR